MAPRHGVKIIDRRLCWAFVHAGVQSTYGTWLGPATVEYDDMLVLVDAHSGAFLHGQP